MFIIVSKEKLARTIKDLIKRIPTKILVAIAGSLGLVLLLSLCLSPDKGEELPLPEPATANSQAIKPKLIYQLPPATAAITDPFNMVHTAENSKENVNPQQVPGSSTNNAGANLAANPNGNNLSGATNVSPNSPNNDLATSKGSRAKGRGSKAGKSTVTAKTAPLVLTGTAIFNNSASAFVEVNGVAQKVQVGDNLPQGKVLSIGKGHMVIKGAQGEEVYRVH